MSGHVIIRLQNLPLEARSIDIRRFFDGLQIPDGGVHIIGGEKGEAFIAFQSDEDARQAMARDSLPLCNARIRLYLSSKTEMQNVIAAARNQQLAAAAAPVTVAAAPKPTSLPSSIEQILFKSASSVVGAPKAAQTPNPVELLTKLLGSNSSVLQTQSKQELDPLKAIASLLPMINQNKSSNGAATTTGGGLPTSNSYSQLSSQQSK